MQCSVCGVQGFQKGQMPGFSQPSRLSSFCNAAVTIMTHNLQSLCLLSLFSTTAALCGAKPDLQDPASLALWIKEPTSGMDTMAVNLSVAQRIFCMLMK